jgi:hypothetical protein
MLSSGEHQTAQNCHPQPTTQPTFPTQFKPNPSCNEFSARH